MTLPDTSNKLQLRDYLDQTLKSSGTFELLAPEELKALRDRYVAVTGATPTGDARPSDEQLSALSHRIRKQSNGTMDPPFTEFAVFGPYDGRSVKLRQFHAHVLTREGSWHNQLLRGPADYSAWKAAWNVYEAAMVMVDAALPGQLRMYKEGIERLVSLFLRDWGAIPQYDETMRSDWWKRLHQ